MEYAGSPFDIKSLDGSGAIEGLLAGFGDVDRGGDRLLKGCFAKTLAARTTPLPMLLHHDMRRPIGAWKSWEERPEGLYVRGAMTLAAKDGQEAYALAKEGALTGLSIGWVPKRETVDQKSGTRTIVEAELFEGSLVAIPMHDRARVAEVKDFSRPGDFEDLFRCAGLSGRKAKAAASAAWKALNESEDEDEAEAAAAAILRASAARVAAIGGKR